MAHQDTTDAVVETPSEAAPDPKTQVNDVLDWDTSPPTGEDDSDIDGGPDCPLPDGTFYAPDSTVDAKPDDSPVDDCPGPGAYDPRVEGPQASDSDQPADSKSEDPMDFETSPTDGRGDDVWKGDDWKNAADPKS